MIRALLVTVLMSVSCSASAQQWTEVARAKNGSTLFVDFSNIKKNGNTRTFWHLTNNSVRTKSGAMSFRSRETIDCANETMQLLTGSFFTEHWAKGSVTSSSDGQQFPPAHIVPGSPIATIMKAVCK